MIPLAKLLEAALFASARPIPTDELAALDKEASPAELQAALEELREHYDVDGHGVELVEIGGGWQILTRPEFTEAIERAQLAARPQRLSAAALIYHDLGSGNHFQTSGQLENPALPGLRREAGGTVVMVGEQSPRDVDGRAWEAKGVSLRGGSWVKAFAERFAGVSGVDGVADGVWTARRGGQVFRLNTKDEAVAVGGVTIAGHEISVKE